MLFADAGLSDARISSLFLLWTTVGILAEVPSGALADRFSRRASLAASGLFQAAGYLLWTTLPGYTAFAAGFVLWGLGGAFGSGALEALLYDSLASTGAEAFYPGVYSRISAVGLLSQIPAAAAAALLYGSGGYDLVGWVSVGCCLAAAGLATRLPEARPQAFAAGGREVGSAVDARYLAVLCSGLAEVARHRAVRAAVVAVALVGGLDGLDEYFPLLAARWGVATRIVPLVVLTVPLAGAAGAALGGPASRLRPRTLAVILATSVSTFGAAALIGRPVAMAGIALAYGLYRLVLVVTDTRLQERIEGPNRATMTSMATLGTELTAAVVLALWALEQPAVMAAVALATAVSLPWLLRPRHEVA